MNANHPKKGSRIKVEPIRHKSDIARIKRKLCDSPRNLCLFVMGINTNLRASDLVRLTCGPLMHLKPGDSFEIREKKTGKVRRISISNSVYAAVQDLLESDHRLRPHSPLFRSQRGGPLTVSSVSRLVKTWCKAVGLFGNYGSHTLRKTWGYHAYMSGIDLPRLMICFNHSSQKQTLDYLCIQDEAIQEIYLTMEL